MVLVDESPPNDELPLEEDEESSSPNELSWVVDSAIALSGEKKRSGLP